MKKILFAAAIALLAMGCCKKAATSESSETTCPVKQECCQKAECPAAVDSACCKVEGECPLATDSAACCPKAEGKCPKAECPKTECAKKATCPKAQGAE